MKSPAAADTSSGVLPPFACADIRAFLPHLDELVTEGLVILDPVEVIRYVGRSQPGREAGIP